jgi:hypothetical protein
VQEKIFGNGDLYFQRGPLVYAYPIPHWVESIKDYEHEGFMDFHCLPEEKDFQFLSIGDPDRLEYAFHKSSETGDPWYQPYPYIRLKLDGNSGEAENLRLVPMGNTVLRQVSFPVN